MGQYRIVVHSCPRCGHDCYCTEGSTGYFECKHGCSTVEKIYENSMSDSFINVVCVLPEKKGGK